MRALNAAQRYAAARPATEAVPAGDPRALSPAAAVQAFEDVLRTGEDTAQKAMVGQSDPHALVEALMQAELAVETVVTVRDKVVEAYQEILRMPV